MGELQQIGVTNDAMTLSDGLNFLCKYGEPRLSKHDRGWHCGINVFVTGDGVAFEVKSDFKQNKHIDAVNTCVTRLKKAMKDLGVQV